MEDNIMETIKFLELKKTQTELPKISISNSKNAYDFIKQFYSDDLEIFESFFILLLNRANQTIAYAKISQGGVAGTYVDVKLIAKYAVDCLASSVILAHNHPSGNKLPSEGDMLITNKAKEGLKLLDINIQDHLIITTNDYYSFADNYIL
jgi:DNA repair protein RadC